MLEIRHSEGCKALEQIAQNKCWRSILKVFKARLGGALSSLIRWTATLPLAGGWDWVIFKVPSNPNYSVIL